MTSKEKSEIRTGAKFRVFEKYGNKCACCGLNNSIYFTIDHIKGNGKQHVRGLNKDLYLWLDERNYDPDFQILCWNCNCAKGMWGSCPHQPDFKWQDVVSETSRRWRIKIKLAALDYYGKQCSCCGETTFEFLTIDHINKDGSQHRKQEITGKYASIYHWLRNHNYPDGFQILCFNCNAISFKQPCHGNFIELPLTYSIWPVIVKKHPKDYCIRKTHCVHGHLYDETNTRKRKDGHRECIICIRKQQERSRLHRGVRVGQRRFPKKLTRENVAQIKSLINITRVKDLASQFSVSPQTICDIKKGRIWKNICI